LFNFATILLPQKRVTADASAVSLNKSLLFWF